MGKEFQRRAKAMILRAAVLRNQIHVKVEKVFFILRHGSYRSSSSQQQLNSRLGEKHLVLPLMWKSNRIQQMRGDHTAHTCVCTSWVAYDNNCTVSSQSPPREGSQGELTPANSQTRMSTNMWGGRPLQSLHADSAGTSGRLQGKDHSKDHSIDHHHQLPNPCSRQKWHKM